MSIVFQNGADTCGHCLCRKYVDNGKPVYFDEACCNCLSNCPCGTSKKVNGIFTVHGCTPCGCGCPVNRYYEVKLNQFFCSSCKEYCPTRNRCFDEAENRCIGCLGCFPASSTVFLENGQSVTISELNIGDRVQSGNFLLL